jgi:hypothetical protein
VEIMERFIHQDLYARYLGVEVCRWSEGYAKAKLELNSNHLNSVNTVHGGVIFSLADSAFSVASNSHGTVALYWDFFRVPCIARAPGSKRLLAETSSPRIGAQLAELVPGVIGLGESIHYMYGILGSSDHPGVRRLILTETEPQTETEH